ncbi:DUF3862 domain-containing protein [Bacillus sp. MUM 13]|uniref:DUF3862 domain-containing protein n=1 Tax=Bacillus sp. MUM 13 TaxID=1678001 RepID=UPI0008F5B251|nr:DUF3862 domain-containing protein [Bacillus sp. MUM 13]OIK04562.1 hypothetical protein BIV59_22025 [Bacillus sp. MUM 13]
MKKIFKFGCLGFIGLIVLIIIIAVATSGGSDSKKTVAPSSDSSNNTTTKENNKSANPVVKEGVLTKEKFAKIKDGMTYNEVVKIVGAKGELLSESGEKGTQYYTELYQFKTDGTFSNSSMMFQGGKLINKAQVGLGGDSKVTITKEEFGKIQNGMTVEEVVKIVGGKGEVISESGKKGDSFYTVMYSYKGEGQLGANANFMFQGNKLQNKSQMGLE